MRNGVSHYALTLTLSFSFAFGLHLLSVHDKKAGTMGFHRLRYMGVCFLTFVLSQSLLRGILFAVSIGDVSLAPADVLRTFALGAGYDLCAGLFFCLPVALLLLILPTSWLDRSIGRRAVLVAAFFMNLLLSFSSAALFCFWQEFHTNFNFIAVDYLIYTTELLGNIFETYPMGAIIPGLLAVAGVLTHWQGRFLNAPYGAKTPLPLLLETALAAALLFAVPNFTHDEWRDGVSVNQYNIELSGDGPYGFVHAFLSNELSYHQFYLDEDRETVLLRLRELLSAENSAFSDDKGIHRSVENRNNLTQLRPHIVIITVESLSSDYSGVFGHGKYTPYLDELSKESFIFTRMYATGTRTVRGLEAISLSVPPSPGQSLLRRANSDNLSSFGYALEQNGYARDFIYGGYGYFDNMNEFFAGNGYTVKDRASIPEEDIAHETVWGVADESLFTQVLKSLDDHDQKGDRAFEMVMTTSNHSPYTFPEGRVDAPQGVRESAVLYTDWAIHDFLERAKSHPWFSRTVFVILADH